ncbi:MAG: hypothetical protein WAK20_12925 [Candidatus Acidiferrum sp.]
MSRKLGAIALAMSILFGAMALKSSVTRSSGSVMMANGPAPVPTKKPGKTFVEVPRMPEVR